MNMSIMRSNSALKNASKCHHGELVVISKQDINKGVIKMPKTVKVVYDPDTLKTSITVDGEEFDTSRIDGREIEDWAYPFMMRKVRWNGFYDEMVEALNGEKEFNLVFEGSDNALAELKESWEDAPVTIISNGNGENTVLIDYDEDNLKTSITINGQAFDTTRIDGREIADWVYPFMIRNVKWNGIFEELSSAVGSEEYTIQFSGSNSAMMELMEECPDTVSISKVKKKAIENERIDNPLSEAVQDQDVDEKEARKIKFRKKYGCFSPDRVYRAGTSETAVEDLYKLSLWYREVELDEERADFSLRKSEFFKKYRDCFESWQCKTLEEEATSYYAKGIWYRDFIGWKSKSQRFFRMSYVLETALGISNPKAESELELDDFCSLVTIANMFRYGSYYASPDYEKALEFYEKIDDADLDYYHSDAAECAETVADQYYQMEAYTAALELYEKAVHHYTLKIDFLETCRDEDDEDDDEYWQDTIELYNVKISQVYLSMNYCYSELGDDESSFDALSMAISYDEDNYIAQMELGLCYFCGVGTLEDPKEAAHYFYKAAEYDYPNAYYCLGLYYERYVKDNEKARAVYSAGARLGSEECEKQLSMISLPSHNSSVFTKESLKKGLMASAKTLGIIGNATGNVILSGIADGAEGLISSILDEDDL